MRPHLDSKPYIFLLNVSVNQTKTTEIPHFLKEMSRKGLWEDTSSEGFLFCRN